MKMGLDTNGIRPVWANDLDEKKGELYRVNFKDEACEFVLDDVHNIVSKDIPETELAAAIRFIAATGMISPKTGTLKKQFRC